MYITLFCKSLNNKDFFFKKKQKNNSKNIDISKKCIKFTAKLLSKYMLEKEIKSRKIDR